MTKTRPEPGDDLIDSRDVIEAIADLEAIEERDEEEQEALTALLALAKEGENCSDWEHGATLICERYFEDYARDLAEDLHGKALANASWPFDCIDWERAAEALQQDYSSVTFGDWDYWVR